MICNKEYSIIGFLILVQFLQEVWATATFRLYCFPSRLLLRRKQTSGNTCSLFSVSVLGRKHAKKSNNWDMPGASLQCHCSGWHSWWLVPGTKTRNLEFIIILPTIPSSARKSHSNLHPAVCEKLNLKDCKNNAPNGRSSWGKGEPIHVFVFRVYCISPFNITDKKDEPSSLLLATNIVKKIKTKV